MKLYPAGKLSPANRESSYWSVAYRRLVSFHYMSKGEMWSMCFGMQKNNCRVVSGEDDFQSGVSVEKKVSLFLDSGAFSAWSLGSEIKLEDYIAFIKQYKDYISIYAVLDVIGDAEGTWQNQKKMEEAGLHPLPCFHFGEPWRYLDRYIDQYDYIALGGLAKKKGNSEMFEFLNACFDRICDANGLPLVKVHGFGVTNFRAMSSYPWYSVDSTTWLITSRMGSILVPQKLPNGEWDYLQILPGKKTQKISVSTVSPASAVPDAHISTLSRQWKMRVDEWLEQHNSRLGKSRFCRVPANYVLQDGERWAKSVGVGEYEEEYEFAPPVAQDDKRYIEIIEEPGVCNDYVERDVLNAKYFKELEARFPKWPWPWKRPALRSFGF